MPDDHASGGETHNRPAPNNYPQDITPAELEFGFRKVEIHYVEPVTVVAKILSKSDILIKVASHYGEITYSHERFGFNKYGSASRSRWHPMGLSFTPTEMVDWVRECEMSGKISKHPFQRKPPWVMGMDFKHRNVE